MKKEEKTMTDEEIRAVLDEIIPDPLPLESPLADNALDHKGHRKRARSKFWAIGGENMSDIDLLEMLLYYANVRGDTVPLAKRLYEKFGTVENIFYADVSELSSVVEVGTSVYTLLAVVRLLSERFLAPVKEQVCFTDRDFLKEYLITQFRGFDKERLMIYALDTSGNLIGKKMKMSEEYGMVRFTYEEILDFLKECKAVAVIMAHNHPNGIAVPSMADLDSTKKVFSYLNENGIALLEHYVVVGEFVTPIVKKFGEQALLNMKYKEFQGKLLLN